METSPRPSRGGRLPAHELFTALRALGLPAEHYLVAGSGPLFAHGLATDLRDLDLIARGPAWAAVLELGRPEPGPIGSGQVVRLLAGRIEVYDGWFPPRWQVDRLIAEAQLLDGVRFMALRTVLEWKSFLDRPKDQAAIRALTAYLGAGS